MQPPESQQGFEGLARRIWSWRIENQPRPIDDMMRIQRGAGWLPDWSPDRIVARRRELANLQRELGEQQLSDSLRLRGSLIASVLARSAWELDAMASWRTDPGFYVNETLGHLFDGLLAPPPFTRDRIAHLTAVLATVPSVLAAGKHNLDETDADLVDSALRRTRMVSKRLRRIHQGLSECTSDRQLDGWPRLLEGVDEAFRSFRRSVLASRRPSRATVVGAAAYGRFLETVAQLPYSIEDLLLLSSRELDRTFLLEEAEIRRPTGAIRPVPEPDLLPAHQRVAEGEVRGFLADQGIIRLPGDLPRYRLAWLPGYLGPLRNFGTANDLAGPDRLEDDATSYMDPPREPRGFFADAVYADPRLGVVHEGTHFYQLSLAWRHDDWMRRHFYDSAPHEGIAFYTEELTLRAGLFDDRPESRLRLIRYMRLRALRVQVDIGLALGTMTVPGAARFLADRVPMDEETACDEVRYFKSSPGQAIAYVVGKIQVEALMAQARHRAGPSFDLAAFHLWLWRNGNVPLSLLADEVEDIPGGRPPSASPARSAAGDGRLGHTWR
jgi:hypothetical protein